VVHARKPPRVAGTVGAHERTFVRTAILKHVDLAIVAAIHHDRLPTNLRRKIVPRLWNLAFMSDIDPRSTEDAIHLQFEQRWVAKNATVNAFGLDKAIDTQIGLVWR
jgi:hypothetical protein